MAPTKDGGGACVGSTGVLACAPLSALDDQGALFGVSRLADGTVTLAASLIRPTGVLKLTYPDGTSTSLVATQGVIAADLRAYPASISTTRAHGTEKTVSLTVPGSD